MVFKNLVLMFSLMFFLSATEALATCNPPYDNEELIATYNVKSCVPVSNKVQVKKLTGTSIQNFEAFKYISDIYIVGPKQEDLYIRTVTIEATCETSLKVKFVRHTHEEVCYYDGQ